MFKKLDFFKTFLFFCLPLIFFHNNSLLACDTTPSLTVGNVIDNGAGTYYMDITACIGSGGSADGFDLYFNNNMNIIATTVTEIEAPITSGNIAPGAFPVEKALTGHEFYDQAIKRSYTIKIEKH